jgi:hypothetical protein
MARVKWLVGMPPDCLISRDVSRTFWDVFKDVLGRFGTFWDDSDLTAPEENPAELAPDRQRGLSGSGGWDVDERDGDGRRPGDRVASFSKALEVKLDRFADQVLDFVAAVAGHSHAGKVRDIGAPVIALVLDYDQVLAHQLCLFSPA